jgi:hypothetical protein
LPEGGFRLGIAVRRGLRLGVPGFIPRRKGG